MHAQQVMQSFVSIFFASAQSIAPAGQSPAQVPHRVHASLTSMKSTVQSRESPR
jgi:hypothetical protein